MARSIRRISYIFTNLYLYFFIIDYISNIPYGDRYVLKLKMEKFREKSLLMKKQLSLNVNNCKMQISQRISRSTSLTNSPHRSQKPDVGLILSQLNPLYNPIRRGRVINSPSSYSGGPRLDSRPARPIILIVCFRCFPPVPPGECLEYLRIRPLPLPTKTFPIYLHSLILSPTLYIIVTENSSLNKLATNPQTQPISLTIRLILIPSCHLRLGLTRVVFPSGFHTKSFTLLSPLPCVPRAPPATFSFI
jgi:hypothetical protein